jgi:hypothetical protein
LYKIKGQVLFKGDNNENAKLGLGYLKIFFSTNTKPAKLRILQIYT